MTMIGHQVGPSKLWTVVAGPSRYTPDFDVFNRALCAAQSITIMLCEPDASLAGKEVSVYTRHKCVDSLMESSVVRDKIYL